MIAYHRDLIQGSDEWLAARCGMLTASEMKLIVTPTLKPAENDNQRAHLWELMAQRITRYVEPHYIGDDQMRGYEDEITARDLYSKRYAPVEEVGFLTNDRWGFTLGYSPDGLVGTDGAIECKSRRQKYQVETITSRQVPAEYMLQLQTGLLVSEREWIDFVSYSGGLPMVTIRVYPDAKIQAAILAAAERFEETIAAMMDSYADTLASDMRLIPTERKIEQEMYA